MDAVSELVVILRRAFPAGIDDREYWAVLAVLYEDMSDENLSRAIADFTGKSRLEVWNDIPSAIAKGRVDPAVILGVSAQMLNAGWEQEEEDV